MKKSQYFFCLKMFFVIFLGFLQLSHGEEQENPAHVIKLRSHEPNLVGYRKDSNDVGFMDFKLSLLYPMLHDGNPVDQGSWRYLPRPYFAFTSRFSQYIGTRESSPVISKRFNPKVIGRMWLSRKGEYLDFGYEHESNGQSIDSAAAYQRKVADLIASGENPEFAKDYISRGWDFLSLTYKKKMTLGRQELSSYLILHSYLNKGVLQGRSEEANLWEGAAKEYRREDFDGLSWRLVSKIKFRLGGIRGTKASMEVSTGIAEPLQHVSTQLEFTTLWWDFPITLWGASGYKSDLVDYYRRVDSFGLAFELKTLPLFADGDLD
jgi:hypothetical protein